MSTDMISNVTYSSLIKESIANMPDTLNTKKEIDEYYKNAIKEVKEKINEQIKVNNGGKAPRKALGVKPAKEAKAAKAAPKKRVKKVEVDADGNEIEKVKKPLNAYQKFIQDNRPKVKEENPGLTGEEYFTMLATMWNKHKEDMKNSGSSNDDSEKEEEKEEEKKKEEEKEEKEDEKKEEEKKKEGSEITVDADDKKKGKKGRKEKK